MAQHGLQTAGLYPMVRGRLVEINGRDITNLVANDVEEINREVNLTWAEKLPEDNHLVAGDWWKESANKESANVVGGVAHVSVEKRLAEKLKLKVGDSLIFLLADTTLSAQVSSIRELSWDRMRPNFFFIFEPGALDSSLATYITSFYLPPDRKLLLNNLLAQFPTISIFEVDQMIARIQAMVNQVTRAIELVLVLTLFAGMLVLLSGIAASLAQRRQEHALLRALGAGQRLMFSVLVVEFTLLGFGAGVIAALGGELCIWALQTHVFQMDYAPHAWVWLLAPVFGASLIGSVGVLSCWRRVRVSPLVLLREST